MKVMQFTDSLFSILYFPSFCRQIYIKHFVENIYCMFVCFSIMAISLEQPLLCFPKVAHIVRFPCIV